MFRKHELGKKKKYKFFRHKRCEFFPCHETDDPKRFNCLMCFCPLYHLECGGNYTFTDKGIKDCSDCTLPHFDYDYVIERLKKKK
jgi:Zn-finger protein